jgi:hypothetical protein
LKNLVIVSSGLLLPEAEVVGFFVVFLSLVDFLLPLVDKVSSFVISTIPSSLTVKESYFLIFFFSPFGFFNIFFNISNVSSLYILVDEVFYFNPFFLGFFLVG